MTIEQYNQLTELKKQFTQKAKEICNDGRISTSLSVHFLEHNDPIWNEKSIELEVQETSGKKVLTNGGMMPNINIFSKPF